MDQMMSGAMQRLGPMMIAQARQANPNLTDAQAQAITEAVSESMDDVMHKVIERSAPMYAEVFTEKELQDLSDFYGTPTGKAMIAKMPVLMNRMAPLIQELTPQMIADIQTRMCAKMDCSKMSAPPLQPKT